ncbi:GNAT family N-acetyltransferase [Maribacter algarum]|uniref:GNAT family N-acetyltransferase n=1 Tax=Maribacter algarum (ex Zhang et al. 2020) TaxID=2578118 RepID=A0A5S3PDZ5_9FLAO|nr:GNAT family N-acetyltransferase [Maribacter algarum]TMM52107.1 GNAT family N-acetyltransferase [Maribacter algarum]
MRINSKIRIAGPDDIPQIMELCCLHAEYEKAAYSIKNKKERLLRDLFATDPKLYCLVVESNAELIGYATYMKQYSTWDAEEYLYLDCIYIKEFARGLGIGEKLVKTIEKQGRKLGCSLIQWQTPDFNIRAIKFYRRIGAVSKNKERFFLKI